MIRNIIVGVFITMLMASHAYTDVLQESTDSYGPFGTLHIYKTSDHPSNVVLFLSGDDGWNPGAVDMARSLAELESMVVGIDTTHYIDELNASKDRCNYAAAHFEDLSQYLQKKYGFALYTPPVLVGYSSGATMVYATLAQVQGCVSNDGEAATFGDRAGTQICTGARPAAGGASCR
jgi:type IV secretory pathway VirJ component